MDDGTTYVTRDEYRLLGAIIRAWLRYDADPGPPQGEHRAELPLTEAIGLLATHSGMTRAELIGVLEATGAW